MKDNYGIDAYLRTLAQKGDTLSISRILNLAPDVKVAFKESEFEALHSNGAITQKAIIVSDNAKGVHVNVIDDLLDRDVAPEYISQTIQRAHEHEQHLPLTGNIVPNVGKILKIEKIDLDTAQKANKAVLDSLCAERPLSPKKKEIILEGISLLAAKPRIFLNQSALEGIDVYDIDMSQAKAVCAALTHFGSALNIRPSFEYANYTKAAFFDFGSCPEGTSIAMLERIKLEKEKRSIFKTPKSGTGNVNPKLWESAHHL